MLNYGNLLDLELIEIDNDWVRPAAYINPDAGEPLQVVEYSRDYKVGLDTATKLLNGGTPWGDELWRESLSSPQYLTDGLSGREALLCIGFEKYPIIEFPTTGNTLAELFNSLKPGFYLIHWC